MRRRADAAGCWQPWTSTSGGSVRLRVQAHMTLLSKRRVQSKLQIKARIWRLAGQPPTRVRSRLPRIYL